MILKVLKSNKSINLLIFPIIGVLLWFKSLMFPFSYQFFQGENDNLLFAPINNIIGNIPLLRVSLSLFLVIFIAFVVLQINDRYTFISVRSKLPASLFIIIVSGFTELHTLHPVYLAAVFLLFAINSLFGTLGKAKPYPNIFNAGFLLGIGSLFYFNMVILFPAFLIGIVILRRDANWRRYVILTIGVFLPFIFAFSYGILTEQTLVILKIFEKNIVTPVNHFHNNIPLHGLISFLIILTLIGSIKIFQQYDSQKVSTRKYFSFFFVLFIFSVLSFAFIPVSSQEMLIIITIPVSYLISNLFIFMKSRFWSELLFLLLIGIVIFMQFSAKGLG